MDYIKPVDVVRAMVGAGTSKLALPLHDLLIRGALAGALLGVATSLAFTGAVSTGQPPVGALIFPVGLIIIVLLGLELVTGSFALVPLPWLERHASGAAVASNWGWVFVANLIGSMVYGALLTIALTNMGAAEPTGVAARIISIAEAKTHGYAAFGVAGFVTAFVKGILCNWMVCLAVVLAMGTSSTIGKIATAWIPIFIFFAQGLRACCRQHVHHPHRHVAWGQDNVGGLVAVESDSRDARQHRGRLRLHRACHLPHIQAATGARSDADASALASAC